MQELIVQIFNFQLTHLLILLQNIKETDDNQVPPVHHQAIGFSKIDAGVTGDSIDLAISSVLPAVGSPDGGTTITITGTGFPKNLIRDFTFQIDGQDVQPQSITNTQIIFVTPKKTSGRTGQIFLSFNKRRLLVVQLHMIMRQEYKFNLQNSIQKHQYSKEK